MQAVVLSMLLVVAGQSNALGFRVGAAELPAYARQADPMVQIWTERGFEPMRPGINTGTPNNPTAWGPEVEFAHDWRRDHPGERLFIVKSTRGSTALAADPKHADWSPASADKLFASTARAAAAAGVQVGFQPSLILWMQGEQDATDAAWAHAYGDNLTVLFREMRTKWADAGARIVFGRIGAAPGLRYADEVRTAQAQVAAAHPDVAMVDTDGLSLQADRLHLDGRGEIGLGDAFYRAAFSEVGRGSAVAQSAEAVR